MRVLVVLFCFFLGSVFAQNNRKPFIKMGNDWVIYNEPQMVTFDISLIGGVHFNDHFSLQFGVNNIKSLPGRMDILTFSVSPTYRILKSKHKVSPVIGLDLGTQLWSNASGRFIEPYYYGFTDYDPGSPADGGHNTRYDRGLFFGKVKLLADFKIKSFNIAIGPTFNSMFIKLERVEKYYSDEEGEYYKVLLEYVNPSYGIGAELSLMYTFPMKKRTEKIVGAVE